MERKMKTRNTAGKKPNKVKEIYDRMQAEKKSKQHSHQNAGKKGKASKGTKFKSQPRSVEKHSWR
jgi:hypothetical protein